MFKQVLTSTAMTIHFCLPRMFNNFRPIRPFRLRWSGPVSRPVLLREVSGAFWIPVHARYFRWIGSPEASSLRQHHVQLHRDVEVSAPEWEESYIVSSVRSLRFTKTLGARGEKKRKDNSDVKCRLSARSALAIRSSLAWENCLILSHYRQEDDRSPSHEQHILSLCLLHTILVGLLGPTD